MGQSGAGVYELDHSRIAKYVRRRALASDELWEACRRECQFYTRFSSLEYPFLPEVCHCFQSEDEIQIILKQYRPLDRSEWDQDLLERSLEVLAQIHALPIPDFLSQTDPEPCRLDPGQIARSRRGWQEVLGEHGQEFAAYDLSRVAEHIHAVHERAHSTKRFLCHGDFHFENLLRDETGNLIVCDWQAVNVGHAAGDISFFLSRLSADGYRVDRGQAIFAYCRCSDTGLTPEEIAVQMSLSNLDTSFLFWHDYLHGCPADRVRDVLDRMFEDLDFLLQAEGGIGADETA